MTEGNIYFYPPEFIDNNNELFSYKPVDIWAFGVTIYTIIFKKLPFLPEIVSDIMGLFQLISEAKINYNANGIQISPNKILIYFSPSFNRNYSLNLTEELTLQLNVLSNEVCFL